MADTQVQGQQPVSSDPTFLDWITYGPRAPQAAALRAQKEQAETDLPTLLALQEADATTPTPSTVQVGAPGGGDPSLDGLTMNLPASGFTPDQHARMLMDMQTLGMNPQTFAQGEQEDVRTAALRRTLPQLGLTQQVDAANNKSVAPLDMNGGVVFNKYDTSHPIVAEDSEEAAKGDLARQKFNTLAKFLSTPDIDPTVAADAVNEKNLTTSTRIKVAHPDGTFTYEDGILQPDGTMRYAPASDSSGTTLQAPGDSDGGPTELQKDTQFMSSVLGIPAKDALNMKLSLKAQSPQAAWESIVRSVSTANFGQYASDPDSLRNQATMIWSVARPGEPVPNGGQLPPAAPAAGASAPPANLLKEGVATKFKNGQTWTLKNGVATQVQ